MLVRCLCVKMTIGNSKTSYGRSYLRGHSIRWAIFFLVAWICTLCVVAVHHLKILRPRTHNWLLSYLVTTTTTAPFTLTSFILWSGEFFFFCLYNPEFKSNSAALLEMHHKVAALYKEGSPKVGDGIENRCACWVVGALLPQFYFSYC